VMSTFGCVCLSVSDYPRGYLENNMHDLYHLMVPVAHGSGSIVLRQGDEIPRENGNFWGFFLIDNALYSITFRTHTKTAELIEMPFGLMTRVGPMCHVLDGEHDPPKEKGQCLDENVAACCKVMGHSTVSCTKRLNRSRCRFGQKLGWAQGTMY